MNSKHGWIIQVLFGYKSSKTTEISTQVNNRDLNMIKSPAGFLGEEGRHDRVHPKWV